MSFILDYHEERKARLVRLGARPCLHCVKLRMDAEDKAALIATQAALIATQAAEMEGYRSMIAAFQCAAKTKSAIDEPPPPIEAPKVETITILAIVKATCEHFGRSYADIVSMRRDISSVWPRQVAMYLAKTLTLRSLPEIGRMIGDRDHTTVLHSVRKIKALIDDGHPLAQDIVAIRSRFVAP